MESPAKQYLFLDIIGNGTFGNVYRARHIQTDSIVAIKIVPKNDEDLNSRVSLQNEINIFKEADHPLIAQFIDSFEDEKNIYIVQECAEGGPFLNFVNRSHGLSEKQCRFYFLQLLSVVEYLHNDLKIVHRDLKMENLLLDKWNNLRLIDFGLSKQMNSKDEILTEPCGTPAYAAPEIIRRNGYGFQIDVWGLGVLLFAMACGRLPFYNDDINFLVRQIAFEPIIIPSKVTSLQMRDLIEKMLIKNPDERIKLNEIRNHPWLQNLDIQWLADNHMRLFEKQNNNGIILDREIVQKMHDLSIDVTNLANDLTNNVINSQTAIYKLLRKKKLTDELATYQQDNEINNVICKVQSTADNRIPSMLSAQDFLYSKNVPRHTAFRTRSSSMEDKLPTNNNYESPLIKTYIKGTNTATIVDYKQVQEKQIKHKSFASIVLATTVPMNFHCVSS